METGSSFPERIKASIRFNAKLKRYGNLRNVVDAKLCLLLNNPLSNGLNYEKLTIPQLYSIRVNDNFRILFGIVRNAGEHFYYLHDIGPHDIYRIIESNPNVFHIDESLPEPGKCYEFQPVPYHELTSSQNTPQVRRIYDLTEIIGANQLEKYSDESFDAVLDRFLIKSAEQKQIINLCTSHPVFVQGFAGTGKTTCVIFKALALSEIPEIKQIVILTYNDYLKRVIEYYVTNLSDENIRKIKVCVFGEFLDQLKKFGLKVPAPYLQKRESIQIVGEILKKRQIDKRAIEIYELIYTLKMLTEFDEERKCHPVYIDESKVRNVIEQWAENGLLPIESQLLCEIFCEYHSILKNNRYLRRPVVDVADMTWKLYKSIDGFDADCFDGLSIIVDEIQDFRPLENEIIFSIVNKIKRKKYGMDNRFSAFGDEHQQITLTNFVWERFVRDFHCRLFSLNTNHRNTQEITRLDEILYKKCLNDSSPQDIQQTGECHGPRPVLFLHDNDEQWMNWLVRFLTINRVPINLGIVAEDNKIYEFLEDRFGKEDSEDEVFVIQPDYCKGLEFDDLIVIKLFHTYLSGKQENAPVCRNYRDLWHVIISRCRTNLLLYLNSGDLAEIESKILGDDFDTFMSQFEIVDDMSQWDRAGDDFLKRCEYFLPGFSRVILNLQKADTVWEKFRTTRNPVYKFRAMKYYEIENAFEKALQNLEDYAEECNDFHCLIDAVYFASKWKVEDRFESLIKLLTAGNTFGEVLEYVLGTKFYKSKENVLIQRIYRYFDKPAEGMIRHFDRILDENMHGFFFNNILAGFKAENDRLLNSIGV